MSRSLSPQCELARDWLAASIDTTLSPEDQAGLQAHLSGCDDCRAVAGWMPQVDAMAVPDPDVAPDAAHFAALRDRVMDQIEPGAAAAPRRSFWRWPTLAPAALVVAAVGFLTVREFRDTPSSIPMSSVEERVQDDDAEAPRAQPLGGSRLDSAFRENDIEPVPPGNRTDQPAREIAGEPRAQAPAPPATGDARTPLGKVAPDAIVDNLGSREGKQVMGLLSAEKLQSEGDLSLKRENLAQSPVGATELEEAATLAEDEAAGFGPDLRDDAVAPSTRQLLRAAREATTDAEREARVRALVVSLTPTDPDLAAQPRVRALNAPREGATSADRLAARASRIAGLEGVAALDDSVAVFLTEQLPTLEDDGLRQRILRWLATRE